MWKTKVVVNEKGRLIRSLICQNSKPELSKWAEYRPDEGVCENWVEVGNDATAILCSECTQRSVNNIRGSRI